MQQIHEEARQRHEEQTIYQLLLEHGLSEQQAQDELANWKRDVQIGMAAPVPQQDDHLGRALAVRRGEHG